MIPTAIVLSIIDSILKLALTELQALPPDAAARRAVEVQAAIEWWRKLLHLPGAEITVPNA